MAVIHQASISPTKLDLVTAWLDLQPWGGAGDVEMIGGYRFDDPAGEVGIEVLLVRREGRVLQAPLTYRGAPLAGAEKHLITTMEHSVLGRRWIHHAGGDPVALACFRAALGGSMPQAPLEIHAVDGSVSAAEPPVRVHVEGTRGVGDTVLLSEDLAEPVTGTATLVAEWDGGQGVVAALA